jgi:magnesium transporter
VGAVPGWTDLLDPTEEELREHLPPNVHPTAVALLLAPLVPGNEPRARLLNQDTYLVGVLLVAVVVPDEDRVFYQEIDFLLSKDRLVTVRKTPPGERPFDAASVEGACQPGEPVGMVLFHLVDEIAERYLDLIDDINDEIDELEENVEEWPATRVRKRISDLRHDLLHTRKHLSPLRDAVHKVVDGRADLESGSAFPRDIELHFGDTYDKLLRATDGLETSRELVAGVRDYFQSMVANDQNEVTKRLTAIASILLVPTFIVGVYGQNFRHIPELAWGFGYLWSWFLIVVTTIAQLVFFRRKRWL